MMPMWVGVTLALTWMFVGFWILWRWSDPEPTSAKSPTPETMTPAELAAYSAGLDHELWPDETIWNHPKSCQACNPLPPPPSHQETTGHEPDWISTFVCDRRLGQAEPYVIPGPKVCRICDEITAERGNRYRGITSFEAPTTAELS